jgi:hypothetical protein
MTHLSRYIIEVSVAISISYVPESAQGRHQNTPLCSPTVLKEVRIDLAWSKLSVQMTATL